jgi:hypothetical protein
MDDHEIDIRCAVFLCRSALARDNDLSAEMYRLVGRIRGQARSYKVSRSDDASDALALSVRQPAMT